MEYFKYINLYNWYNNISEWVIYIYPSKKQFKKEELDETVSKLQNIRENIDNRINNIDTNIKHFLVKAKELIKINKKGALYNLKLKKRYMMERDKLYAMSFNIEAQIFSIESMGLMIQTADTLKSTSMHMNTINKHFDIDRLETTMEELQEQKDIGHDLQTIISESMSMDIDEDELLTELNELENEGINVKENINIDIDIDNKNNPSDTATMLLNELPIAPTSELKNSEDIKEAVIN